MSFSPDSSAQRFVSCAEFASLLSLSAATVRRMCRNGTLESLVVSARGDRRIPLSEIGRLVDQASVSRRTDG